MKKLLWLLIVLPIVAFAVAVAVGIPMLDWVAWLFNGLGSVFQTVGNFCSWLQTLLNSGVIKK